MTARNAQVLLIAVITTRATALLFSKVLLVDLGPFALLGVRFLLAFVLLALIFRKRLARMNGRMFLYGLALGVLQVGWIGVFGAVGALVFQEPVVLAAGQQWASLAVLVIACIGFAFTLQPLAQKRLSPERASLTLAVDPLVASALGIVVLGEQVGAAGYLGMALILLAIVSSCLPTGLRRKRKSPLPRAAL